MKRRIPSVNCNDNDNDTFIPSPDAKRLKISKLEPDCGQMSDDNNTTSTTSQSVLTPSPHFNHSNVTHANHDIHHAPSSITFDPNMIDLGIEFPQLPQVLNVKKSDELALDSTFDLAQFTHTKTDDANNKKSFPVIFNWEQLSEATNPQRLRTEALRKQERGKYVRRDSLSSEQAADRRRRQNRESARRTRDRVRKYITVLEMYYAHIHKVNCLLVKQLEVMAKHCTNQLTDDERANLKMYTWPKPPTIEECINAKPATISATSSVKKSDISPLQTPTKQPKTNNTQTETQQNKSKRNVSGDNAAMNMRFDNMPLNALNLPTLNLSQNALNNLNHHNKQNGIKTSQINIMQMNHHNNMNILNQMPSVTLNKNNVRTLNQVNALKPFEQELLQCGISLNNGMNSNNPQYLIRPVVNPGNILTFQTVPNNNNVLTLRNVNVLPTQLNNINNMNMMNGHN